MSNQCNNCGWGEYKLAYKNHPEGCLSLRKVILKESKHCKSPNFSQWKSKQEVQHLLLDTTRRLFTLTGNKYLNQTNKKQIAAIVENNKYNASKIYTVKIKQMDDDSIYTKEVLDYFYIYPNEQVSIDTGNFLLLDPEFNFFPQPRFFLTNYFLKNTLQNLIHIDLKDADPSFILEIIDKPEYTNTYPYPVPILIAEDEQIKRGVIYSISTNNNHLYNQEKLRNTYDLSLSWVLFPGKTISILNPSDSSQIILLSTKSSQKITEEDIQSQNNRENIIFVSDYLDGITWDNIRIQYQEAILKKKKNNIDYCSDCGWSILKNPFELPCKTLRKQYLSDPSCNKSGKKDSIEKVHKLIHAIDHAKAIRYDQICQLIKEGIKNDPTQNTLPRK